MRLAYADPPYPGMARKHYKADPRCAEVDHLALIAGLAEYDGWALSTSSTALRDVLALCPAGVRVAAWVKPYTTFWPGVNPGYCWEPVIYSPSPRKRPRSEPTVRDWLSANMPQGRGLVGRKPEAFCFWLFALLGMVPGDTLVDLFPGSGIVGASWERWQRQLVN